MEDGITDGADLRHLLRQSVETLVKEAQPPPPASMPQPYLASFATVALEQRRPPLEDSCATTLRAILRRHADDVVVRGCVLASNRQVQIRSIGFHRGKYHGSTLNVAAVPFYPLPIASLENVSPHSVLNLTVQIDTPTQDVELIPTDMLLPFTFWDCLQPWTPGCSFGGFTFSPTPPSRFSPAPSPSINHVLKQDRSATNIYAVDGMLFTYSAPSVTSYIVRPKLHQDESLSYRALSKQQMQQWAADKRTQAAALHRQGKQSDAVAAYTTAIDMDKDDVEAYVGRGRLFVEMQRMDEARQDVEAALKLHPLHEAAVELQHKLLHHASSSSSMEDAMLARMKGEEGGSGGVASSKHPDRLRALLEMDIQSHAKEKKKDKKEHKKKEKKKHKKRSRSHDNRSSSSSSARKKSR